MKTILESSIIKEMAYEKQYNKIAEWLTDRLIDHGEASYSIYRDEMTKEMMKKVIIDLSNDFKKAGYQVKYKFYKYDGRMAYIYVKV